MIKRMHKNLRELSIVLIMAMFVSCFANMGSVQASETPQLLEETNEISEQLEIPQLLEETDEMSEIETFIEDSTLTKATVNSDIICEGNGTILKVLANGKIANIEVKDSVINITVGSQRYGYYSSICVGSCMISDDDLLHIFWHSGQYYVYDLYESDMYFLAGSKGIDGTKINYYMVTDSEDKNIVKGSSASNVNFKSPIIDKRYFYMYGTPGKKELMTREEFNNIVRPVPTATPTPVPTATPTPATPTPVPTATPTMAPLPTRTPDVQINEEIKIDKDTHTEFDAKFWYNEYDKGKISWEQYCQMAASYGWTIGEETVSKKIIDRKFDANNNCYHEEETVVTYTKKTGNGTVNSTEKDNGKAEYEEETKGEGGVEGTVDTKEHEEIKRQEDIYVNNPNVVNGGNGGNKNIQSWSSHRKKMKNGDEITKLVRTVNGKDGTVCKVKKSKKGVVKFDGITYKNVRKTYYTSKSRQIVLHEKKRIEIVARNQRDGRYVPKKISGNWKVLTNKKGLANKITNGKVVIVIKNMKAKKVAA